MKFKSYFAKLYIEPAEGQNFHPAIVAFKKRPMSFERGGITSYHNTLVLNLWLVELWFDWTTNK